MDYKFIFTLLVTVCGWGVSIGMFKNKLSQHDKEIEEIKKRQNNTDTILQSINNQLTSLNTKVDLIIKGKILTGGNDE